MPYRTNKMNQLFLSFVPDIILAILLIHPQLIAGLGCFECSGSAAPLCEGKFAPHQGRKNVSCPGPHTYIPHGFTNRSEFSCAIMKSKSYTTGRIEIMKGCVLSEKYFALVEGEVYLRPGECYIHNEAEVPRDAIYQELTICICREDNCNERTFLGFGEEDIEQRRGLKRGNTASLLTLSSVLIIVIILINIFLEI